MKGVCAACGIAYDTDERDRCPNCEETETWDEPA